MAIKLKYFHLLLFSLCLIVSSCAVDQSADDKKIISIENSGIKVEFDQYLQSRIVRSGAGGNLALGDFTSSEYVVDANGRSINVFQRMKTQHRKISTDFGPAEETTLEGVSSEGLHKVIKVLAYSQFPGMLVYRVRYQNQGPDDVIITKWVQNAFQFMSSSVGKNTSQADFWVFQGASFEDRRDWVTAITPGFQQQNYMGMNASDYGSGTPVLDVWRKDVGIGIGHLDLDPKLVSLPIQYKNQNEGVRAQLELEKPVKLTPGATFSTLESFVQVHQRDYYATLKAYREMMKLKGLPMVDAPEGAYESVWCAWGYERNFSVEEVLNTLPKARELGMKWAVLDDGWQTSEGDWYLDPKKFPNGDADMKAFVKKIEEAGLKAKLWWAPLAADPGTDILKNDADVLLLNEDGSKRDITWWDSYYMCPAYEKTREHTVALVKKIIGEWGFSGLKIDGQHLNGVPPCFNPEHHHEHPEDSVDQLAEYWKLVYDTATAINPEAVVEICPCGTSYAFHNLPFMNQAVSSDPLSSWQIRHKGKTIKALMGESAPYYGDHVELSDNASDFASSFGIGAVLGSKFTLPSENPAAAQFVLNAEKEKTWQKWFSLYSELRLSQGEYLGGLYDIGFDRPEAHAVAKAGRMYYAFYAKDMSDNAFSGDLELRGLVAGREYQIRDYVNDKSLGLFSANKQGTVIMPASFKDYLLVDAVMLND
ncbi:hypothetical protein TDB9533_03722 [Thalassocella blandensis]|nr:hypothetical protein TDB9533_03722 [Thalassocella blandensis]